MAYILRGRAAWDILMNPRGLASLHRCCFSSATTRRRGARHRPQAKILWRCSAATWNEERWDLLLPGRAGAAPLPWLCTATGGEQAGDALRPRAPRTRPLDAQQCFNCEFWATAGFGWSHRLHSAIARAQGLIDHEVRSIGGPEILRVHIHRRRLSCLQEHQNSVHAGWSPGRGCPARGPPRPTRHREVAAVLLGAERFPTPLRVSVPFGHFSPDATQDRAVTSSGDSTAKIWCTTGGTMSF